MVMLITGASIIAGCSSNAPPGGSSPTLQGSPETTAPPTRASSATPAAPALPPVPDVTLDRPAPGSVQAVDFTRLIPFLPAAPAGWVAGEPEGTEIKEQDVSWTIASRRYTSGAGKQAEVSIMDSAYYDVGAWTGWAGLSETTTDGGYVKSGTVAGFPSWESYDKTYNSYDTWVGLDNRFLVTVTITNGPKADLDSFVNSVNYPGIAILK